MSDRQTHEIVLANARLVLERASAMPRTDADFRRVAEASLLQLYGEVTSYTLNGAVNGGFSLQPDVEAKFRAAIVGLIDDIRSQPISFDPNALPSFVRLCEQVVATKTDESFQAALRKIVGAPDEGA